MSISICMCMYVLTYIRMDVVLIYICKYVSTYIHTYTLDLFILDLCMSLRG